MIYRDVTGRKARNLNLEGRSRLTKNLKNLAHLCALLIEDTYGPLYSHIFSTLTTHGRLSARDISRKCHLSLPQVISGLAVLTECLFVFHHTAPDGRTSYQANQTAVYNLVRVGRFTQLIRRKFGVEGANILNHLLVFGHDTGENLRKVSLRLTEHGHSNGFDRGEDTSSLEDPELEHSGPSSRVLDRLIEHKYLIELRSSHFQTWSDTWRAAEVAVKASGGFSLVKGKKGQEEFEQAVRVEVHAILNRDTTASDVNINGKRTAAAELHPPGTKKYKRSNGVQENGIFSTETLNDLYGRSIFRLDLSKLLLLLKHQMISDQVRQRMGSRSGRVLEALLRQCEIRHLTEGNSQLPPSAERHSTEEDLAEIDMNQLLYDVNNSDDISFAERQNLMNGHANGSSNSWDGIDMEELEEEVATLAEGSCQYIRRGGRKNIWCVNMRDAEERLRDDEIMQMVKRRFGLMSLRIIRILMSRGKVDEKALQEIGLLNAKDLRRCLAQLHAHGFIDLQEVPREPQRQPARTLYLWFYDAERVKLRVLENLYKSMCRLLQRLKVERQKVSSTILKAERSDVKGREQEMLRSDEIIVLKRWRRKELWYLSELERLGSSVDVCASN